MTLGMPNKNVSSVTERAVAGTTASSSRGTIRDVLQDVYVHLKIEFDNTELDRLFEILKGTEWEDTELSILELVQELIDEIWVQGETIRNLRQSLWAQRVAALSVRRQQP